MRIHISAALALACLGSLDNTARAQPPSGPAGGAGPSPAFSPYLNLTRQGVSPVIGYYGIVRPQNQLANSVQGLQRQIDLSPFASSTSASPDQPSVTGHAFGYQNQYLYFQNQYTAGSFGLGRAGGAGGGRTGGQGGGQNFGGQPFGAVPAAKR